MGKGFGRGVGDASGAFPAPNAKFGRNTGGTGPYLGIGQVRLSDDPEYDPTGHIRTNSSGRDQDRRHADPDLGTGSGM